MVNALDSVMMGSFSTIAKNDQIKVLAILPFKEYKRLKSKSGRPIILILKPKALPI